MRVGPAWSRGPTASQPQTCSMRAPNWCKHLDSMERSVMSCAGHVRVAGPLGAEEQQEDSTGLPACPAPSLPDMPGLWNLGRCLSEKGEQERLACPCYESQFGQISRGPAIMSRARDTDLPRQGRVSLDDNCSWLRIRSQVGSFLSHAIAGAPHSLSSCWNCMSRHGMGLVAVYIHLLVLRLSSQSRNHACEGYMDRTVCVLPQIPHLMFTHGK